jgi:hypothetical protein
MCERDVEFRLDLWFALAMALGKSEQRLIAGMVRECLGHLVTGGQVDTEIAQAYLIGIRAPF